MFNGSGHLRRRVHISRKAGSLSVRIERQNTEGLYFWFFCLGTVVFGMFCYYTLWGTALQHRMYTGFGVSQAGDFTPGLRITDLLGEEVSEMQHSRKFMEQMDTSKVRATGMVKSDSHVPWRSTRCKPHYTASVVKLTVPR